MIWLLVGWWMLNTVQTPAITGSNVAHLRPVMQVEFAELGAFRSGWFALSDDGEQIAVTTSDHRVLIVDAGEVVGEYTLGELSDAIFYEGRLLATHTLPDTTMQIVAYDWRTDTLERHYTHVFEGETADFPVALWADEEAVTMEMLSRDFSRDDYLLRWAWGADTAETLSYAIRKDPEAVVRVGRVPLPYVVTSSVAGVVKLWHLARGEVLAEVDHRQGFAATFGNINAPATHFVWRDNNSEQLYLLDWQTGHNVPVAPLGGAYAQWYFLGVGADVILAVNLDGQPNVVYWNIEAGEAVVLGDYRACERPQPDMARLSVDGSTLVIGCDSGLEVWRVSVP